MLAKSISHFITDFLREDERVQLEDFIKKPSGFVYKYKIDENLISLNYTDWQSRIWLIARGTICPVKTLDDFVDALDNFSYFDTPTYSLSLDKYQMKLLLNYSVRGKSLTLDSMRDLTIGFSARINAVKALFIDECVEQ